MRQGIKQIDLDITDQFNILTRMMHSVSESFSYSVSNASIFQLKISHFRTNVML